MPSTWLYLIRHGEVEEAARGRFFGHADVPLSATGCAQAEALGRRLGREAIQAVYSSDLLRARQSAGPLAAARGVEPVAVPAFREVAMGRWEGLTLREIREREPEAAARWLADPVRVPFPGGESLEDLRRRVMPAIETLLGAHAGGRIAVVAHGGVNRVVLGEALGLPLGSVLRLAQDYAGVSLVEYRERAAVLCLLNERVDGLASATPVERSAGV